MGPSWAHAFVVAGLLTLAGTPVLRRIALATGFVDHPEAAHKSHTEATPYLGGVGLILAVLVALLFTSRLTPQVGVVALGGSVIGCLGLFDDHRSTGALFRFTVEAGVAAVALIAGLRIHATDVGLIDGAITIVWIVGVTNSVNLLDNMDGAATGISAAAGGAIFVIAILGEQAVTAVLAAGLVGACLGFLFHNKRPASIFMGDSGSLFLGFVLAVVTIDVSPALRPPASFMVPVMLLALPVLDTATVTVSRLRRRRSVVLGGKDHLAHRLAARGLSPGGAVAVLIGTETVVGALAVLASREVLPLSAAVAATTAVMIFIGLWTARADVYTEAVVGFPRRVKLAAAGGAVVFLLLIAPAVTALVRAHGPGVGGASAARRGLAALAEGNSAAARTQFQQASAELERADSILGARINSIGLAIPILRANLATARALVTAGRQAAGAGADLSALAEASQLPLTPAAGAAAEAARLAPAVEASVSALTTSVRELAGYNRPYLWPGLGTSVRDLRTLVTSRADDATRAADLLRVLPGMFGAGGPRRYFVAVQDDAELRGGGGVIHMWAELEAANGHLTLSRFGSAEDLNRAGSARTLRMPAEFLDRYEDFDVAATWQNVNVSPDFSVTGRVIADLYPQSGGAPLDGVLAVDVPGLAALLDLSGPVHVDGLAAPLTGAALAGAIGPESYGRFPVAADRQAYVARVVETTLRALTSADLGSPARVAAALSPAARAGHVQLYSTRPDEEAMAERLGMSGQVHQSAGDSLMVVNQNLSAAAIDRYLRREVRYDMVLDPNGRTAALSGHLAVTLHNDAPPTGPAAVIGPVDGRLSAGENRTYLSVYTSCSITGSTLDGQPTTLRTDPELGRVAYSAIVSVPSRQSRLVGMDLQGDVPLDKDGWYHLDLLHQTSINPDDTEVSLSVPPGWQIADSRGLQVDGDRHAGATLHLDSDGEVAVRLERTAWSRLWSGA